MTKDFVSSEESGEDIVGVGENKEKWQVLYVKLLQWRAPKVGWFFKVLDHKADKKISAREATNSPPCYWRNLKASKAIWFY